MITDSPSFFPPRQIFACPLLSRLPHYLRARNRLPFLVLANIFVANKAWMLKILLLLLQ